MIHLELLEEGVIGAFIGDKKNSRLPGCPETRGLIDQSKRIDKQEAKTIRQILKGNKGLQRFFNKNHERSFGRWDIRPDAEPENLPVCFRIKPKRSLAFPFSSAQPPPFV